MSFDHYLILALLVAACIPVLDVVATWFYLRATNFIVPVPSVWGNGWQAGADEAVPPIAAQSTVPAADAATPAH